MDIGERIKTIRKINRYSRKEFAVELDIPYSTLTNYENGSRRPPFELLLRIAITFGTTVDYLLGTTDDPNTINGRPGQYGDIPLERSLWDFVDNIGYEYSCFGNSGRKYITRRSDNVSAPITDDEYRRVCDSIVDFTKYSISELHNTAISRDKKRMDTEMRMMEDYATTIKGENGEDS